MTRSEGETNLKTVYASDDSLMIRQKFLKQSFQHTYKKLEDNNQLCIPINFIVLSQQYCSELDRISLLIYLHTLLGYSSKDSSTVLSLTEQEIEQEAFEILNGFLLFLEHFDFSLLLESQADYAVLMSDILYATDTELAKDYGIGLIEAKIMSALAKKIDGSALC